MLVYRITFLYGGGARGGEWVKHTVGGSPVTRLRIHGEFQGWEV